MASAVRLEQQSQDAGDTARAEGEARVRERPLPIPRAFVWLRMLPATDPLVTVIRTARGGWQRVAKRLVDVSVATVLLVLALPLVLVAALAIKLEDGGPVLFRQERVGKDGRRFVLYKLRTMVLDADAHLGELAEQNLRQGGPLFKLRDDPRVTAVGRLLREGSIDELPQLVNVLRGSMSLVGPRPALPDEVAQFDEQLLQRLYFLPGVTGLWQIFARDDPSFDSYRRLDLLYLARWSLRLDAAIMLATVWHLASRLPAAMRAACARSGHRRAVGVCDPADSPS